VGDARTPLFRSTIRVGPVRKSEPAFAPKNRYETAEDLGQGGMGRVARGVDRFLGRPVAFKRSLEGDPQMLEALLHEAEIAARLDHPSIVTIHDVAHDEHDEPFVVMRLVDGQPLSAVLEGADLAARLRLLPRVVSAIEAIAYAHTQGVVHRDLKPDNILVANRGDTVVIDWGLALDMRAGTDPFEGSSVGTPGFMAPEQARGERADPRVDVYALGVTLFYVLSGKLPGDARPSLATVAPGVPADLVTIVDKACSLDREARYPTATELAAELDRFIGGQLVASHRYGLVQRVVRWLKLHRIAVAIAAVAVAASVTFGVIALRRVLAARALAEHEGELARAAERREADRADQLLVDRARAAVADDPARAIALLDLRAKPRLDPAARMVAIDAIAHGIPRSWKAHAGIVTQLAALGGDRFASGGFDGTVKLHDGDRGTKLVASYRGPVTMVAPVTGGFVVKAADAIEYFDPRGVRIAQWTTPSDQAEARGDWIVEYDLSGGVVRRLDNSVRYPLTEAVVNVDLDSQTRWLAIATEKGASILDLATGKRRQLDTTSVRQVVFSPKGDRVMFIADGQHEVEEWSTKDWTSIERFASEGVLFAYLPAQRVSVDSNGCLRLEAKSALHKQLRCLEHFSGAYASADGWVMVGQDREAHLFDGGNIDRLSGAADTVVRMTTEPTFRYVFAGTRSGYVTMWDRHDRGVIVTRASATAAMMHGESMTIDEDGKLARIDRDGKRTELADIGLPGMSRELLESDGSLYAFHADGPLMMLHDGEMKRVLDGHAHDITKRNASELLVLTTDDRLVWLNDAANKRGVIIDHEGTVSVIGGSEEHGAMAVGYTDGRLWWKTGRDVSKTARVDCRPTRVQPVAEDVEVACGDVLYVVGESGPPREVIRMKEQILEWSHVGERWILVTATAAVWRYERGTLTKVLGESESRFVALARDRFATIDRISSAIWIHDLASDSRARLGTVHIPSGLWFSADGRSLMVLGRTQILRWSDPTPANDVDWKSWRSSLTRATLSQPNAALQWP